MESYFICYISFHKFFNSQKLSTNRPNKLSKSTMFFLTNSVDTGTKYRFHLWLQNTKTPPFDVQLKLAKVKF